MRSLIFPRTWNINFVWWVIIIVFNKNVSCTWADFVFKYSYFQVGGTPEHVIELLSKNYIGVAQMANMVAEWLILGGKYTFWFLLNNFFW